MVARARAWAWVGGNRGKEVGGCVRNRPMRFFAWLLLLAQAAADVADLNLDIHVDTVTAAKIRELARAKDLAVANEDYDEAKRLKASIDRLKVRSRCTHASRLQCSHSVTGRAPAPLELCWGGLGESEAWLEAEGEGQGQGRTLSFASRHPCFLAPPPLALFW